MDWLSGVWKWAVQFISTLPILLWVAIVAIAGIAFKQFWVDMYHRIFGTPEPKKRLKIQRITTDLNSIFEVVNSGTREITVRKHGVRYYDGKENCDSLEFSKRLIGDAHMPLTIGDTAYGHFYKYQQGAVYYVYVEDAERRQKRLYPDGFLVGHLKHLWYRTTKKDFNLPAPFDKPKKGKKIYP